MQICAALATGIQFTTGIDLLSIKMSISRLASLSNIIIGRTGNTENHEEKSQESISKLQENRKITKIIKIAKNH